MTEQLAGMSALEAVVFNVRSLPPASLLEALYTLPNLISFECLSTPLNFPLTSTTEYPLHLQRLVLERPIELFYIDDVKNVPWNDPTTYLPLDNDAGQPLRRTTNTGDSFDLLDKEHSFTASILHANISHLRHLELDMELVDFDVLSEQVFPNISTLIFHGFTLHPSPSYSFLKLKGMRTLREISFFIVKWGLHNFRVLPSSVSGDDTVSKLFPQLKVFRMSNAHPDDAIFKALPNTVRGIHLRTMVVWTPTTTIHTHGVNTGPLTSGSLAQILGAVRARGIRSITDFSIVLSFALTPNTLSAIVDAFPDVEELQIKGPFIEKDAQPSPSFSLMVCMR